jgi:succinate-semialdehyde dehydrogenase/glutarate-semialdehyde dehydrogenase
VLAIAWIEISLKFSFPRFDNGDLGNGLGLPANVHLVAPAAFIIWALFFAAGADMAAATTVAIATVTGATAGLVLMVASPATLASLLVGVVLGLLSTVLAASLGAGTTSRAKTALARTSRSRPHAPWRGGRTESAGPATEPTPSKSPHHGGSGRKEMPVAEAHVPALTPEGRTGLYVDGHWVTPQEHKTFEVRDPSTGQSIATVVDAGPADALRALDAAVAAQDMWSSTPPRDRANILRHAYDRLWDRRDEVATTITREMGKSLTEAQAEVRYGAEFLRWFSEEAVRIGGRWGVLPEGTGSLHVARKPVGPCYLVTPWNFPLAMATRKIAPALAAGCTVVLKPADLTPLTAMLLVDVLEEAGLPPGVVNLVTSTRPAPISQTLLADPRLRKLSFTGSTTVGRLLLAQAAQRVLRCSMELGGNAPFIVLEGADVDAAVEGALAAKFRNVGQACTAANRFLVHDSLADEFAGLLAARTGALKLGPGLAKDTDLGPMITQGAVDRSLRIIDDAVQRGAALLTGGSQLERPGHFLEPTVLMDVSRDSLAMTEEIFAPIAPIARFDTRQDALERANVTDYGLAAYVFAPTLEAGQAVAAELEAGIVGINMGVISNAAAPFGGVKSSGLGREGGIEGIDEYLSIQYRAAPLAR